MAKAKVEDLSELRLLLKDNILGLALLEKAEFMEKTLKELKAEIEAGGVITSMCQGNYNIERANPALQAYNVTIKNYASVVKQLNDMLAKNSAPKSDSFEGF